MNKLLAVVITLGALLLNPTFAMEVKANIPTFIASQFRSADVASGVFLYNDTLLYMIENNKIVRVDLEY